MQVAYSSDCMLVRVLAPTHGYATAYSGVNLDSYNRKVTFQHLTEEGIRSIGHAVEVMAENEQLDAHKNAMTLRVRAIEN